MKFKAEFEVFVKINVFAKVEIENDNPELLLEELRECGLKELPTCDQLLRHLFVGKAAYAGKCNLSITHN